MWPNLPDVTSISAFNDYKKLWDEILNFKQSHIKNRYFMLQLISTMLNHQPHVTLTSQLKAFKKNIVTPIEETITFRGVWLSHTHWGKNTHDVRKEGTVGRPTCSLSLQRVAELQPYPLHCGRACIVSCGLMKALALVNVSTLPCICMLPPLSIASVFFSIVHSPVDVN